MWPDTADDKNRTLYMTLCLKTVHDKLIEERHQDGHQICAHLAEKWFGSWSRYTDNLYLAKFPEKGKGSLQERAQQGYLVGILFGHVLFAEKPMSLSEGIKEFLPAMDPQVFPELPSMSEESFLKNYWSRYKHVAHFWYALTCFTLPEPSCAMIRLDQAEPHPVYEGYGHGWRGIAAVADAAREKALTAERYKTHKNLLDSEKSLRVVFSDDRP